MIPLIDGDVTVYEAGFAVETGWTGDDPPPFDAAADKLDSLIANICAMVDATHPPIIFLTGKTNFRNEIAKRQPYKERVGNKPYHYHNLKAYIKGKYEWSLIEGLEADDGMAIMQTANPEKTIICTRDKDLRSVPGWHYGWELGNQPQFGPEKVSLVGGVQLSNDRKKIKGTGLMFFYSQCLTGDTVDSIPGLPKCGPVKAYEILEHAKTEEEAFKAVLEAYQVVFGARAEEELLEQGRLLHMTRELHEDGSSVLWEFPKYD